MTFRSACTGLLLSVLLILAACAGKQKLILVEQQKADAEALRVAALETIDDPQRAEEAASLIEELHNIMAAAAQDERAFRSRFSELNRSYSAERAQFEALFESYNVNIEWHQKHALAVREKMAQLLTLEEWGELDKARKRALKSSL